MGKYSYAILKVRERNLRKDYVKVENELNELGSEGWKLISITPPMMLGFIFGCGDGSTKEFYLIFMKELD